jgi:alcohol-forming fatty acyl-CoA reductase
VKNNSKGLPLAVFRPAIVIPTYKGPIEGWIDNMYGPTGIVIGVAAGLLRVLHIHKNNRAEIVPVDLCVNSMIACAHDISINTYDEPPIYNYVSSVENEITWNEYCEISVKHGRNYPLSKMAWFFTFTMTSSKALVAILTYLYHLIPAALVDFGLFLSGKKPRLELFDRKMSII